MCISVDSKLLADRNKLKRQLRSGEDKTKSNAAVKSLVAGFLYVRKWFGMRYKRGPYSRGGRGGEGLQAVQEKCLADAI